MWKLTECTGGNAVLTDGAFRLRLQAYAENVVRVTQTGRAEFLLRDEPMIVRGPGGAALELAREEGAVTLSAGALSASVDLDTGALTWRGGGEIVMREPAEGGRVLREVDVIRYRYDPEASLRERVSVDGLRTEAEGEPYADRKGYQTRLSFELDPDEAIYGLGQHEEGVLNYRGGHQFLYQENLKIACPVVVSSKGWAVLNNCCGAQIFHDDAFGSYLSADCADEMDYFVIYGPELDGIVGALRFLTGDAPMLPRWALGYIQSKEHYHTAGELEAVAAEYRRRGVGLDCVVQDWQTWPQGQWGQKTVDEARYPDLPGTVKRLHGMNVRLMWSIWPNMAAGTPDQAAFAEKGWLLGNRTNYDPFEPGARALYWSQCAAQLYPAGVDGWWCDCTEPFESDWFGPVKMFPEDRMRACVDAAKRYLDPTQALAYSILHTRGIYEGQRAAADSRRVLILTRSGLPGQQRYGAVCWNGDTSARWDVLRKSVADGLNFCACGLPWWTEDAGAFFVKKWVQWFGDGRYERGCEDERYRELYVRWLQLCAFLPMMRSHGTDTPREVWRFGEPGGAYYDAVVKAIRTRYRLMPYLYSEMARVSLERSTLMRMLAFDFRSDRKALNVSDQFMLGQALMVCPILDPMTGGAAERDVYLPAGRDWFDFRTGERFEGGRTVRVRAALDEVPLFAPAGSLVPTGGEVQYADQDYGRDVTMRVFAGADGRCAIYNDAGDGYGYERGEYARLICRWDDGARRLNTTFEGDRRFAIDLKRAEITG